MTQSNKTKPILSTTGDYVTIISQEKNELIGFFLKEDTKYVFKPNPDFEFTDETNEFIVNELELINQS